MFLIVLMKIVVCCMGRQWLGGRVAVIRTQRVPERFHEQHSEPLVAPHEQVGALHGLGECNAQLL